jgi:hypothetical protein
LIEQAVPGHHATPQYSLGYIPESIALSALGGTRANCRNVANVAGGRVPKRLVRMVLANPAGVLTDQTLHAAGVKCFSQSIPIPAPQKQRERRSGSGRCSAFASSQGARITAVDQTRSRASSMMSPSGKTTFTNGGRGAV